MEDLKKYYLLQKVEWDKVQDIINNDSSYRSIYIDHPSGVDRLSNLKLALTIVYESGYASVNHLMFKLGIGETLVFSLMDFMWDQNIIEREGEEPTYLGF
ncbi:hypothetical protein HYS96_00670 [Candidatus Daviesbacteria bacterium]|nr:hypothetical protein [Candidatus Daviesbacteria bacterium]